MLITNFEKWIMVCLGMGMPSWVSSQVAWRAVIGAERDVSVRKRNGGLKMKGRGVEEMRY
jgi:hypothetical protein